MVGVVLPPTVAGALVNLGLTLKGRIPVNLNFTAGREALESAISQCEIQTIITSRLFLKKVAQVTGLPHVLCFITADMPVTDTVGLSFELAKLPDFAGLKKTDFSGHRNKRAWLLAPGS